MNPKYIKAYLTLKLTALIEHCTYKEVYESIEESIMDAYSTAVREENQAALDAWKKIPCKGNIPTPLELIDYLGRKCKKELESNNLSIQK